DNDHPHSSERHACAHGGARGTAVARGAAGLRFKEATDILPGIAARLREEEQPDIVVLVSDYGFAQEVSIARRVDGIDVVPGWHSPRVDRGCNCRSTQSALVAS
ncbi:MAG: hypothetical protein M3Z30_07925, partial [Gemmatimonadota bacterium]|nr:hypothetical protein [Gemmatimonadota bacterium]